MTIRFGNKNFPDTVEELVKHRGSFGSAFRYHCQDKQVSENTDFLFACYTNEDPQKIFFKFIAPTIGGVGLAEQKHFPDGDKVPARMSPTGRRVNIRGVKDINIDSTSRQQMIDLAADQNWSIAAWQRPLKKAVDYLSTNFLVQNDTMDTFFKSQNYYFKLVEREMIPQVTFRHAEFVAKDAGLRQWDELRSDRMFLELVRFSKATILLKQKFNGGSARMESLAKTYFRKLNQKYRFTKNYDQIAAKTSRKWSPEF